MHSSKNFRPFILARTLASVVLLGLAGLPAYSQTAPTQAESSNNVLEFALTLRGVSGVFAKVEIGKFSLIKSDVEATPRGSLYPALMVSKGMFVKELVFRPFGFGSKLALEYDRSMKDSYINVFEDGNRFRTTYGERIVLCEAGEPTADTCYRLRNMRISYAPVLAPATGNVSNMLSLLNKTNFDKLGNEVPIDSTVIMVSRLVGNLTFTESAPSSYAQWLTPELKRSVIEKAEQGVKQATQQAEARAETQKREAENRTILAQAEAERNKRFIFESPVGTLLFCSSSRDFLVSPTTPSYQVGFSCDRTGEYRHSLRNLAEAGWDVIGESRTPVDGYQGIGYILEFRFKKVRVVRASAE